MTNTEVFSSYNPMGSIADYLLAFPTNIKAVSTYKRIIEITTDQNSLDVSKKILEELQNDIKKLPKEKKDVKIDVLKEALETTKQNQLAVNKLFDTIDYLFEKEEKNQVTIDDEIMLHFLGNMKKAQSYLIYIFDYISLILKVNTPVEKSTYSCYDLSQMLKN
jgi:hypothetical protein